MRRWRIRVTDASLPVSFSTDVMQGIGTPALAQWCLAAVQRLLPASHCTVFALEADGHVSAVSTASELGAVAAVTAVEYLSQGFDQLDSNMVWLRARKTPRQAQVWMTHQFAADVPDEIYRRICYGDTGIRERASVLLLRDDGRRIAISFYRNLMYPPFDASDFDTVAQCARILEEAVLAHVRVVRQAAAGDAIYQKVMSLLPHRERQVVSHILSGKTTREIADLLALSQNTVLTYRYRAFAKLGVRTQRELLATLNRLPANLTRLDQRG